MRFMLMRQREWGEPCAGKLARMVRREVAGNTVRLCAGYPPYFLAEGFDFLGFNVRIYRTKTNHSGWKVLIKPSKKSVLKIRKRLREEWLQLRGHSVMAVIKRLNPIIRGWANYFRTQVSTAIFDNLDQQMFHREVRYTKHTHPDKPWRWQQAKYWEN